ncbi:hypothetical protein Rhe02_42200 [Rhizocola hellebori]|uniref:Cell envelope-related transcriptional attenuator domain-containing protein n=1 Tax=Rhizocola hellebori TaxID=1392758 RepID=A0A8J3Q8K8_9ACTN|nr:LCP family protein [Rhizocola hellebori]GIH06153.1 hypothetical protein Rhe02_42200 [Rhizocola hellebori]
MAGSRSLKKTKARKRDHVPRWARWCVLGGAMLMIIGGGGLFAVRAFINKATSAIGQQDLLGDAGDKRTSVDGPITMLLVGMDVRENQHDDSVRADTIIMVYIPASHDQAYMVSLPRDLQVKIPDYKKSDFRGWTTKINTAFQGGYQGPGTEKDKRGRGMELLAITIKNLTGITFDGAAIIDFAGFEAVLQELGGVTMCVEAQAEAIHLARDKNGKVVEAWYDDSEGKVRGIPTGGSKLIYLPGCQRMAPNVALEYSRLRKGTCCPNGDYDRQRHQQQLIKAIISEATNKNMLTDLGKLNRVIQKAGQAFVLDTQGVAVADYLFTLKDIKPDDLISVRINAGQVHTVPGTSDEALTADSKQMLAALRDDQLPAWLLQHTDFLAPSS